MTEAELKALAEAKAKAEALAKVAGKTEAGETTPQGEVEKKDEPKIEPERKIDWQLEYNKLKKEIADKEVAFKETEKLTLLKSIKELKGEFVEYFYKENKKDILEASNLTETINKLKNIETNKKFFNDVEFKTSSVFENKDKQKKVEFYKGSTIRIE